MNLVIPINEGIDTYTLSGIPGKESEFSDSSLKYEPTKEKKNVFFAAQLSFFACFIKENSSFGVN